MTSSFNNNILQRFYFFIVILTSLVVTVYFYVKEKEVINIQNIEEYVQQSDQFLAIDPHTVKMISEINTTEVVNMLKVVKEANNTEILNFFENSSEINESKVTKIFENFQKINESELLSTLDNIVNLSSLDSNRTHVSTLLKIIPNVESRKNNNNIQIVDTSKELSGLNSQELRVITNFFKNLNKSSDINVTKVVNTLKFIPKIQTKLEKDLDDYIDEIFKTSEVLEQNGYDYFLHNKDALFFILTILVYVLVYVFLKIVQMLILNKPTLTSRCIEVLEELNVLIKDNESSMPDSNNKKKLVPKLINKINKTDGFKLNYWIYKVPISHLVVIHDAYYKTSLELEEQNKKGCPLAKTNNHEKVKQLVKDLNKAIKDLESKIKKRSEITTVKLKKILDKYSDNKDILYYDEVVFSTIFTPPLTTLNELKISITDILSSEINKSEKEFIQNILKNLEELIKKQEGYNNKVESKNENFNGLYTLYKAVEKEKEHYENTFYKQDNKNENTDNRKVRHTLENIKFSLALEKDKKRKWKEITEIIEQKAHHVLLTDFKTYKLRIRAYSIQAMMPDFKEIIQENKILNIYYKVYNIISPLKNKKIDGQTYEVKDDLIKFLKTNIEELHEHKINTAISLLGNFLLQYLIYASFTIISFLVISLCIYPELDESFFAAITKNELVYFNSLILISLTIIVIAILSYYIVKKFTLNNFILYKSLLVDYINNITLVFIVSAVMVAVLARVDTAFLGAKEYFHSYNEIGNMFTHLLFPSGFDNVIYAMTYDNIMLNSFKIFMEYTQTGLTPFKLLVYKFIFLSILAYLVFTIVNFVIKKYDAIYFNDQRKTLIPPELATIAINFLLGIFFLIIFYGTTIKYLNFDLNKHNNKIIKIERSCTNTIPNTSSEPSSLLNEDNEQGIVDYIPFSIFITLVGGLLTMATRDLLENYFAGLSLQMDSPYEEHDRITINNSEMYEVNNIGIRADKFYGIKSNAIIVIPHKELIGETIVNYTLPTLDYRHELTIYIPHTDFKDKNGSENKLSSSIPKRAEMLLMLAIYVNTGVKLPTLELRKQDEDLESNYSNYDENLKVLDLKKELRELKKLVKKVSLFGEDKIEKRVVSKEILYKLKMLDRLIRTYTLYDELSDDKKNELKELIESCNKKEADIRTDRESLLKKCDEIKDFRESDEQKKLEELNKVKEEIKELEEKIINDRKKALEDRNKISTYVKEGYSLLEIDSKRLEELKELKRLNEVQELSELDVPERFKDEGTKELKDFTVEAQKKLEFLEDLEELRNRNDKKALLELEELEINDMLLSEDTYENSLEDDVISNIWKKLEELQENYDPSNSVRHPLTQLFMLKVISAVKEAERDGDQKSEVEEKKVIRKIKATVASIILALEKFQSLADEELHHHIDKNFALRKYKMFRGDEKPKAEKLHVLAKELVHINYYYFSLANSLWKLKDLQESLFRKREIDSTSLELLDVPRVSAEQIYSGEGNLNYWKVTANITLELSEQSNEIIHHISMYIDSLWDDFELPKHYTIEDNKKDINIGRDGLEKLVFSYKK